MTGFHGASGAVNARAYRRPCHVGLLPHALDLHIVTHSEVRRVAKLAIRSPLGELHLHHEPGFRPVRLFVCSRRGGERARLRLERLQLFPHASKFGVGETGAGMSHVLQAAVAVMNPKEQSAEKWTRAAWFGPAADDARLVANQFQLAP